MPSLITTLSLHASGFNVELQKAVAKAQQAGGSIEKNLSGGITNNGLFQLLVSPIGLATAALTGFIAKVGAAMHDMTEQAAEVKRGALRACAQRRERQDYHVALQTARPGAKRIFFFFCIF